MGPDDTPAQSEVVERTNFLARVEKFANEKFGAGFVQKFKDQTAMLSATAAIGVDQMKEQFGSETDNPYAWGGALAGGAAGTFLGGAVGGGKGALIGAVVLGYVGKQIAG